MPRRTPAPALGGISCTEEPDSRELPLRLRGGRPRHCPALNKPDELAAFQLIELHSVPSEVQIVGLPNLRGSVSGYASHSGAEQKQLRAVAFRAI